MKVKFHWDRLSQGDEESSCWVRVAQAWAGTSFGVIHVPRIGQEVIVDFLEGDPDRPIISIGTDDELTVGANRSATVGASDEETVTAAQTISVGGGQSVTVGGSQSVTVAGGRAGSRRSPKRS